jgi:hypothetical protein
MNQSINHQNHLKPVSMFALVLILLICWSTSNAQEFRRDPALITGPDACGECHEKSVESWKATHHFKTFKELPHSQKGRKIARNMGLKRIKAGSDCLTCHFTTASGNGETKQVGGITCESCHGAGAEWIEVHSDFGGKDVKAENEDPAHKIERYSKSEAAGMIRPGNMYALAENCYGCHSVPNEKLVNVGGHAAGSAFELVAWTQGEVRHNIWYTANNTEASIERKRVMYVVGKMLDLEFAYRGLAEATEKARYAVVMAKRVKIAKYQLAKIDAVINSPEVKEVLGIADGNKLKLSNRDAYLSAAGSVAEQAKKVATMVGGDLAGVDALLPTADKYKGTPLFQLK